MLTVFTWLPVVTPNTLLMVPNGDDQVSLASTNLPQRAFSAQQVLCTNLSGLVTGYLFKKHFNTRRGASDIHHDSKLPWGLPLPFSSDIPILDEHVNNKPPNIKPLQYPIQYLWFSDSTPPRHGTQTQCVFDATLLREGYGLTQKQANYLIQHLAIAIEIQDALHVHEMCMDPKALWTFIGDARRYDRYKAKIRSAWIAKVATCTVAWAITYFSIVATLFMI